MLRDIRRFSAIAGAAGLQLAIASVVHAQATAAPGAAAPAGGGLEAIVVTAQRREEKLNDVPMTVTVFSQENLDQQGIKGIDDLSRVSPGVTFIRNGMGASGNYNDEDSDISIRGIDSTAGAATTGIYIDDTPIQTRHLNFGTVNPYPALFDLERVEVLKGPQGTLFGAGSEGGTVRFITPDPSLHDVQVYARAEYGSIDGGGSNYESGLAVGGPIIDGVLGFRVSASFREDGGWVNRVSYNAPASTASCYYSAYCPPPTGATLYGGSPTVTGTTESNANWHDTQTFRAALKWAPADNLSVSPSIYAQTLHNNDTGAYWANISAPADNVYNNGNAQRDPSTDPWYLGALKVEWSLPSVQLTSNTSYFSRAQHSISDYTQWFNTVFAGNQYPPASQEVTADFTDRQDNLTQEFRASSTDATAALQWTGGLYYSHVHENSTEFIYNPASVGGVLPDASGIIYHQPVFSIVDKQLALFGELSYNLNDQWKFTAGLRASRIDSDGFVQEYGSLVGVNVNSVSSSSEHPITPRFVLNYKPGPDNLLYASAAKGFRPGGVNPELPPACGQTPPSTFSSDSLWLYEVGSKNTLFEHKVQFNASLYYLQWKNIQQFVYLACGLGFVPNLGEVEGKGGDIDVQWRVTEDLTVGAVAAYTDSAFTSNLQLNGLPLVTSQDHLPASPININANLEYVFNSVPKKPYFRADYQFATAQHSLVPYQDPGVAPNSDPTLPGLPEIRILSLRGGLRFSGADISLFAQNLLNYHTPIYVSRDLPTIVTNPAQTPNWPYGSNFDTNYFGRGLAPRTIGISATYRY